MLPVSKTPSPMDCSTSPSVELQDPDHDRQVSDNVNSDDETARVRFLRRKLSVSGTDINLDGFENDDISHDIPNQVIHKNKHCINEYFGKSQKGYVPYNLKKANQDTLLMKEDLKTGTIILAVFDGHGEHGHCVSESISDTFYRKLINHPLYETNLKEAAVDSLDKAESQCIQNNYINSDLSGTTANIWIIRNTHLLVLNVGDSRGMLVSQDDDKLVTTFETEDHKPAVKEESDRILENGGRVFSLTYDDGEVGPLRVWLKHSDIPGLAMTRSLGDCLSHTVGVLSTPTVYERELTDKDKIIVIATDGLWEFITKEEVVGVLDKAQDTEDAVNTLSSLSWKKWYNEEQVVDDITIIVACMEEDDEDNDNMYLEDKPLIG
ncbi:hypothetical protein WA158_000029 [Blastocystis sp. Blastoise]